MYKIINNAKDCSVRKYIQSVFEERLEVLIIEGEPTKGQLLNALENIQTEYIDLSNQNNSNESILVKTINALKLRISIIKFYIQIHRDCILFVGEPYHPAINDLKKFGHKLFWDKENPNIISFLEQLNKIESKEKRTDSELSLKLKEYTVLKSKEKKENVSVRDARISFLKAMNNLGKFGYSIDKDKTTVEEFALMVREYADTIEAEKKSKTKK